MKEKKNSNPASNSPTFCSNSTKTVRQILAKKSKTKALLIKRQMEIVLNYNRRDIHNEELNAVNHERLATPVETDNNTESDSDDDAERHQQVYSASATYVEDFMDYSESVADHTARYVSRMRQNHAEFEDLIGRLNDAMDILFQDKLGPNGEVGGGKSKVAVLNVENLLLLARDVGDDGVTVSEMALSSINDKLHHLNLDEKNLQNSVVVAKATRASKKVSGKSSSAGCSNSTNNRPNKASCGVSRKKPSILSSMAKPSNSFDETVPTELSGNCPSASSSAFSSSEFDGYEIYEHCLEFAPYRKCRLQNPPQYTSFSKSSRTTQTTTPLVKRLHSQSRKKKAPSKKSQEISSTNHQSATLGDQPLKYCSCNQVSYGKMVGCDNKLCPVEWFHFKCVGLKTKPKGDWYCPKCRLDDNSSIIKPNDVFLQELEEYNMQRQRESTHPA